MLRWENNGILFLTNRNHAKAMANILEKSV